MFIKIKLEPKIGEETKKDPKYFELDDDGTILEVKTKIEQYIDIKKERQVIKSLTKTAENHEFVKDFWKSKECNESVAEGVSLMLYSYRNDSKLFDTRYEGEPIFFCFLQLYNKQEAVLQQEYERKMKSPSYFKNIAQSSTMSSVAVVHDSDSENNDVTSESTSSESDSGSDTESKSSTSDESIASKKRKKNTSSNDLIKIPKSDNLCSTFSPTLYTYLDEFPRYSENTLGVTKSNDFVPITVPKSSALQNIDHNKIDSTIASTYVTPPSTDISQEHQKSQIIQRGNISTSTASNIIDKHPCAFILPEKRDFIVVICNESAIRKEDCKEILNVYFNLFRESSNTSNLRFNEESAVVLYEGNLWIACDDINTSKWLLENTQQLEKSYNSKAQRLRDHLKLCENYVVVIPNICKSNNLHIFELISKQNEDLNTTQWVVRNKRTISDEHDEFFEKSVSSFCSNEVLFLTIDKESKQRLEQLHFKLKYCFWQIVFEESNNLE